MARFEGKVDAGAIALWHLKKYDNLHDAAKHIWDVIDSGAAMNHLNIARQQ